MTTRGSSTPPALICKSCIAGSFGQFLFAPFGVALIDNFGWQSALTVFALLMPLVIPLSLALATPAEAARGEPAALLGFLSALINLPIVEAPVRRAVAQPA